MRNFNKKAFWGTIKKAAIRIPMVLMPFFIYWGYDDGYLSLHVMILLYMAWAVLLAVIVSKYLKK